MLICNYKLCVLQAGRKLVISPGSWLGYGADIHSEGNALLMKQHLPALLQGLLLLQQCLTQAQPHHKTQMQTTGEFRLVTLAAMSFLYTALEGPSQAPSCTFTPGKTYGMTSIPCAPNTVSLTESLTRQLSTCLTQTPG